MKLHFQTISLIILFVFQINIFAEEDQRLTVLEAANQGDASAQRTLGIMYLAQSNTVQSDTRAAYWLRKAADQGDAGAQRTLGIMYLQGRGVPPDDAQAAQLFQKAALQGDQEAQINLGVLYANGQGIKQDDVQAVAWYRKAAEQGNVVAQRILGNMYLHGRGVQLDSTQALQWFHKAAEQGDADAQYNIGLFFLTGIKVPQDFEASLKWFSQSVAKSNNPIFHAVLRLPARRGILESSLTLQTDNTNRILDPGTYVIFLPDEKRILHPHSGTFTTEPRIREGETIKIQAQRETSDSQDTVSLHIGLTTDFLIRQLFLDDAALPLSKVGPDDNPQLIRTEASVIVSPTRLTNGAILKIISRGGREHLQSITLRDGELTVAPPSKVVF